MPVTWQECKLVEMEKNFPVPTVNCSKVNSIPYCDYKQVHSTVMKNKLTCEVSSVSVTGYYMDGWLKSSCFFKHTWWMLARRLCPSYLCNHMEVAELRGS